MKCLKSMKQYLSRKANAQEVVGLALGCIIGLIIIFFLSALSASASGVALTIENDFFGDKDNNYSHGTELEYFRAIDLGDSYGIYKKSYGFNQLMYTPTDLRYPGIPEPGSRPWAGTFSIYYETLTLKSERLEIRTRYSMGWLGPRSKAERTQKAVHKMLDNTPPQGWEWQMPNEFMVNLYHDRYYLLDSHEWGRKGYDFKGILGGTLGTVFTEAHIGAVARLGHNVPKHSLDTGIAIKTARQQSFLDDIFFYGLGELKASVVGHNATIGESIFRNRFPTQEKSIEHIVGSFRYGGALGYRGFAVTYIWEQRTDEFKDQTDGGFKYGMLKIEYNWRF